MKGIEKVIEYKNKVPEKPAVSVLVVTYNHEKYISRCLDSILNQRVNFNIEVLLGEDFSSDGTRDICIEYARNYPETIKLFLHSRDNNITIDGKSTGRYNFLFNVSKSKGKYIAICEGDDYWTDNNKLQKQVDFLENNSDYVMCSHDAFVVDDKNHKKNDGMLTPEYKKDFTAHELLLSPWIPNLTRCFRNVFINQQMPEIMYLAPNGDQVLTAILGQFGGNKYLGDKIEPAAYMQHNGGVWSNKPILTKIRMTSITNKLLAEYFETRGFNDVSRYYKNLVNNSIKDALHQFLMNMNRRELIKFKNLCKDFYVDELDKNGYRDILKILNKKIAERIYTYPYYKLKNIGKTN